jgi:hypothetical protein
VKKITKAIRNPGQLAIYIVKKITKAIGEFWETMAIGKSWELLAIGKRWGIIGNWELGIGNHGNPLAIRQFRESTGNQAILGNACT